MSAFPSAPKPSPELPKLVPQPPLKRGNGSIIIFVVVFLAGTAWFLRPRSEKAPVTVAVRTVKPVRGAIESTRRVAGSVSASRYSMVVVPVLQAPESGRGLTLTFVAPSGSVVKEGQLVAEIDGQDMKDHLSDVEATVSQAELDLKKKRTVNIAQMEMIRQRVRQARADLLKAKEDIKALEVRNAITQEQLKLSAEEYQATYDQVSEELKLMEDRQAADMNIAMIEYDRQLRHRNRHRHDVAQLQIHSPMSGMVVLQTTSRNGELTQIRVGDLVSPGQPFMRVVDAQTMQLDAMMSQTEAEMLRLGMNATVHFDAFPEIVLPGKVKYVGQLALGSRRVNYYIRRIPVQVTISQQDARVIPDLSASADIRTAGAEGLIVPREAIAESSGKSVVYVRNEGGITPREVEISGENNTQVVIAGGLQEGDDVVLDPHSVINP